MKKPFTLQPYVSDVQKKAGNSAVVLKSDLRFRNTACKRPSNLVLHNILGFAASYTLLKTAAQGSFEVLIN
jgi:hypothetical protein